MVGAGGAQTSRNRPGYPVVQRPRRRPKRGGGVTGLDPNGTLSYKIIGGLGPVPVQPVFAPTSCG
jgi:hypothetical protein